MIVSSGRKVREGVTLGLISLALLLACHGDAAPGATEAVSGTSAAATPPETALTSSEDSPNMSSPYRKIRPPAVAGSWYSDHAATLSTEIDAYLGKARVGAPSRFPLALVAPHAGYRYSGPTAGKVYAEIRGANVRRVWVLSPTHRVRLSGIGLYPNDAFHTPLGDLPVDVPTVERLSAHEGFSWLPRGDGGEHALEIQLPFLIRALGAFELVPLLVGDLDAASARRLAEILRPEIGPGDLVVVSSDFSHHGPRFGWAPFKSEIPRNLDTLDHAAWAHVAHPDTEALAAWFSKTNATICGRNPLVLLTALLPAGAVGTELDYTTSGNLTGDWDNSVSYLGGRLDGPAWTGRGAETGGARLVSPETAEFLLQLARRSLDTWFETGRKLEVDASGLPQDASNPLGAFVTLQKNGELRGCIGEITPSRPVWMAVLERAVDAAIHDPRFPPVTAAELPSLHIDISLLGPSYEVSGPEAIILGRHGIVLSQGYRRATFLPQVAPEQGWDRATTIRHLAMKAGISQSALSSARYEVYEAQVVGL
jgi:hypothetical protein